MLFQFLVYFNIFVSLKSSKTIVYIDIEGILKEKGGNLEDFEVHLIYGDKVIQLEIDNKESDYIENFMLTRPLPPKPGQNETNISIKDNLNGKIYETLADSDYEDSVENDILSAHSLISAEEKTESKLNEKVESISEAIYHNVNQVIPSKNQNTLTDGDLSDTYKKIHDIGNSTRDNFSLSLEEKNTSLTTNEEEMNKHDKIKDDLESKKFDDNNTVSFTPELEQNIPEDNYIEAKKNNSQNSTPEKQFSQTNCLEKTKYNENRTDNNDEKCDNQVLYPKKSSKKNRCRKSGKPAQDLLTKQSIENEFENKNVDSLTISKQIAKKTPNFSSLIKSENGNEDIKTEKDMKNDDKKGLNSFKKPLTNKKSQKTTQTNNKPKVGNESIPEENIYVDMTGNKNKDQIKNESSGGNFFPKPTPELTTENIYVDMTGNKNKDQIKKESSGANYFQKPTLELTTENVYVNMTGNKNKDHIKNESSVGNYFSILTPESTTENIYVDMTGNKNKNNRKGKRKRRKSNKKSKTTTTEEKKMENIYLNSTGISNKEAENHLLEKDESIRNDESCHEVDEQNQNILNHKKAEQEHNEPIYMNLFELSQQNTLKIKKVGNTKVKHSFNTENSEDGIYMELDFSENTSKEYEQRKVSPIDLSNKCDEEPIYTEMFSNAINLDKSVDSKTSNDKYICSEIKNHLKQENQHLRDKKDIMTDNKSEISNCKTIPVYQDDSILLERFSYDGLDTLKIKQIGNKRQGTHSHSLNITTESKSFSNSAVPNIKIYIYKVDPGLALRESQSYESGIYTDVKVMNEYGRNSNISLDSGCYSNWETDENKKSLNDINLSQDNIRNSSFLHSEELIENDMNGDEKMVIKKNVNDLAIFPEKKKRLSLRKSFRRLKKSMGIN